MRVIPGERVYYEYQVLIGHTWITIDVWYPLMLQTRGMRGYRMLDVYSQVVKLSNLRSVVDAQNY